MIGQHSRPFPSRETIRLGYVALVDCAPLVVAQETGIFEKHGLSVRLSRELGWASVRDRIYQGELDAAQAITGIAFALSLGFSGLRRSVAVPMILNLHGNAITLSREIHPDHVTRSDFRHFLKNHWRKDRPFTLAATHRYSSHHILLLQWLKMHQLHGPEDVDVIFLPPPLMASSLAAGHIDGYCVGEPWNSVSILENHGWCVATSSELSYHHPEKALLVSDRFMEENREQTITLVRALVESCELCQDSRFRKDLIEILAMPQYTGSSREVLMNSLGPVFEGGTRQINTEEFHIFSGPDVNQPTIQKASWTLSHLRQAEVIPETAGQSLSRIYREDLYHAATS
jgi:ABC-type nitrate/sulfonate/bicarbonate transport system substrate-binding protein